MTQHRQALLLGVEIVPAQLADAPILENLLELYAHDFSEFQHLDLMEDGRFGYPALPLYWADTGRHAFFIKVHGRLAGLVFVKQGSEVTGDPSVWDMAEFFVLRGHRTRGIGKEAARQIWVRFSGKWEVRIMQANLGAMGFWNGR